MLAIAKQADGHIEPAVDKKREANEAVQGLRELYSMEKSVWVAFFVIPACVATAFISGMRNKRKRA